MSEASSPKRARLDYEDSKDEHFDKYGKNRDQDEVSNFSQSKSRKRLQDIDDETGKEEEGKAKSLSMETARREHHLVMRLTNKEQELQDCMNQMQEMKQAQTQNTAQLRSMLLDPAINLVFQRMAKEMDEHKEKLKHKQNELSAWKFTADSQTGMRLMAKCRMLLQENGELGKMISSGRTARLEGEIALHKALVTEMKQNQKELDEFVGELEEDVEGMQGMIFMLQQQLKEAREQISRLQQENEQLRTLRMPPDPEPGGDIQNNYGSSGNNTPHHEWPEEIVVNLDNSYNLNSSGLKHQESSSAPFGSSYDRSTNKSVIPPALSALSSSFRTHNQTFDDGSNGTGALMCKLTPDSGMYTQEEEDASVDHSDSTFHRTSRYNKDDTLEERTSGSRDVSPSENATNNTRPSSTDPSSTLENDSIQQPTTDVNSPLIQGLNGSNLLTDQSSNKTTEYDLGRTKSSSLSTVMDRTSNSQFEVSDGTDFEKLQKDGSKSDLHSAGSDYSESNLQVDTADSQIKLPLVNGTNSVKMEKDL